MFLAHRTAKPVAEIPRAVPSDRPTHPAHREHQRTISIKTVDEDGQPHEYHSLDELPPELRAEVETLETEALKENAISPRTVFSRTTSKTKITKTIKTVDKDGQPHEYHFLDELPPELRAEAEKLEAEALKDNINSPRTVISRTKSGIYKLRDASGSANSRRLWDSEVLGRRTPGRDFTLVPGSSAAVVVTAKGSSSAADAPG